ncbi:MAG TPA: ABC transporter ATP-binding protein [Methanothermobacter sp.]|jgi:NitT/TauT family transport system ATP-binding protein|uniref:Nitrate ABC transporter ATP-binding protein n=1 Tax=Methanothermobacter tenebrarum TaxID=680118 RepID=A0ABM7YDT8_9EURY|nr:ABC transporter ATP-binding protein [Methanothermobacter tenebrarum]MDD3454254.1 ABC transporter ATP-binding protein [Methanobacteriales archaeon]MDX9693197.1 ABC transporter ATP-binding protein [Methanothermobacter sp.]BDH79543.1 nitrate ABC transporter ATP-binding protein [Methanothermobacter tenebrarum]HHW15807.1 ABC transporter ATP-binding protein [Methanothermobacter sp.]
MPLKIEGLSKKFKDRPILEDINLQVEDGEFLCIVGPSGCGKTTLLRIIAGLEEPTTGRVFADGKPVKGPGADRGFVFQQYTLFPWRTVLENVTFGLELKGLEEGEREKIAMEYLKLVGLEDFKDAYPYELSGGMKQRVAIVRALANNPKFLLMDEPFAALDIQTRNLLQKELLYIWEKTNETIIFVTHNVDEAVFLADRIVVLSVRPGRILRTFKVEIERIRDRLSKDFLTLRGEILNILEKEVKLR